MARAPARLAPSMSEWLRGLAEGGVTVSPLSFARLRRIRAKGESVKLILIGITISQAYECHDSPGIPYRELRILFGVLWRQRFDNLLKSAWQKSLVWLQPGQVDGI